jgi:tol-pal system protein YbgF
MMSSRNNNFATAILPMAVLFLVLLVIGCATPRHIDELRSDIARVESQNRQTQTMLTHSDSLLTEESENNRRLRADMSVTIDQLQQQITTLQENYNDLLQKVDAIYRIVNTRRTLSSSPGAQDEPPVTTPQIQQPVMTPTIDCATAYDDAFMLVRRGEYEKAIDSFRVFLSECEKHELAQNAHYWIGESYYSLEQYHKAIEEFEWLLENYQSSVNASRALYKLGRSQQELGKKEEARKIFKRLIDEHPGTLEAEQAKERLKDL